MTISLIRLNTQKRFLAPFYDATRYFGRLLRRYAVTASALAVMPDMPAHKIADVKNGFGMLSTLNTMAQVVQSAEITANGSAANSKQPNARDLVPGSAGER